MNWHDHSNLGLEGSHAFLGGSNYAWRNYSDEKLKETYINRLAKEKGTILHEEACRLIKLGIEVKSKRRTFNMYVNDAISFGMRPEELLFYSMNCYGWADTISYNEKKKFLRIHDLKTGVTPASLKQLEIYAALFCLEYGVRPGDLNGIELRIYQNDDILIGNPEADDIAPIMDDIIHKDKILEKIKEDSDTWIVL